MVSRRRKGSLTTTLLPPDDSVTSKAEDQAWLTCRRTSCSEWQMQELSRKWSCRTQCWQ